MPHFGSVLVTSRKPLSASSYQKECKSATARLNFCCATLLQDTAKLTRPSFSPISCLWDCISCAPSPSGNRNNVSEDPRNNLLKFITIPPVVVFEMVGLFRFENDLAANHGHHAASFQNFHLRN